MNLVPPSFRFFFNSGPKTVFSLLLEIKCDQQTNKNDVFNYGINLKKIIQRSPITILPMFRAGEFPRKIEAYFAGFDSPIRLRLFFAGFEGFLWVWIMESQNVMGIQVMGVKLVLFIRFSICASPINTISLTTNGDIV